MSTRESLYGTQDLHNGSYIVSGLTQFQTAFDAMKKGDVMTYHVGFLARDRRKGMELDAIADEAHALEKRGQCMLVQRRVNEMVFAYIIIRITHNAKASHLPQPDHVNSDRLGASESGTDFQGDEPAKRRPMGDCLRGDERRMSAVHSEYAQ